MKNNSKFGGVLSTVGVLGGIYLAMKQNKKLGQTALYAVGFGVAGLLLGNAISKFYE
jgi:hypothetical protein